MNEQLNLTQEWDKVFPKSDKVDHRKVSFRNRHYAGRGFVYPPEGWRKVAGYRRFRPLRSREGTIFRALCPDDGRARFSNDRV